MSKTEKKPGRPKTRVQTSNRAAAKQTKEGEEKYIIIATTERIEKMKDVAYWDRLTLKETFAQAIDDRVKKYERKNGVLRGRNTV